jgi:hypothetical protein
MPVIPVNKVVDKKIIIEKRWLMLYVERHLFSYRRIATRWMNCKSFATFHSQSKIYCPKRSDKSSSSLKDVPGGKSFMTARREKAVKRRKMKF